MQEKSADHFPSPAIQSCAHHLALLHLWFLLHHVAWRAYRVRYILGDLLYFSFFTSLVTIGLAVCFQLMVGVENYSFSTVSLSLSSLFMMLCGEFDSTIFRGNSKAFIIFCVTNVVLVMILLNTFIAVLADGYDVAKTWAEKKKDIPWTALLLCSPSTLKRLRCKMAELGSRQGEEQNGHKRSMSIVDRAGGGALSTGAEGGPGEGGRRVSARACPRAVSARLCVWVDCCPQGRR